MTTKDDARKRTNERTMSTTRDALVARDGAFIAFLSELTDGEMDELYAGAPWASLAALRALDSVGKQIVLRMTYGASGEGGASGIDRDVVERWFRDGDGGIGAMTAAMERLGRLRVLRAGSREERMKDVEGGDGDEDVEALMRGEEETTSSLMDPSVTSYVLHPAFAANVRRALERGFAGLEDFDAGEETKGDAEAQSKAPDRATLNAYAKSKWEDLLLTLTGASDAFAKPGSKVRLDAQALFRAAGLTTATASGIKKGGQKRLKNAGVTAAGFRFLLTTAQEQIWVLLTQYIADSQKNAATIGVISFLLRLTFQQPGRAYAMTGALSETEQDVVRDLTHLGLLYTFEVKKKWYYVPTLLSSGLSSGFSAEGVGDARRSAGDAATSASAVAADSGHIIVETNYRVYAYTSSLVEMEILRLFTRADYRLPNLYVGMLTRESVQNALRAGVDAEQIVAYIRAHAHKQVRRKKPSVPNTVCDQIRLWARDMERVDAQDCVLYCDFPTAGGFYEAVAREAAKRPGVLLWKDDVGRKLTVRASAHESMKSVVAVLKKKHQQDA